MKKIIFLSLVLLACSKQNPDPANTSTKSTTASATRVTPKSVPASFQTADCIVRDQQFHGGGFDSSLSFANKYRILELIQANNINPALFYFNGISEEYDTTYYGIRFVSYVYDYYFAHGLPVFTYPGKFIFTDNHLDNTSQSIYQPTIALDTTPRLDLSYLKDLYNGEVANDTSNLRRPPVDCINAEFGYYDLNYGMPLAPQYVKAWRLYPKIPKQGFPVLFVKDDDGSTIFFTDGFVF